VEQVRAQVKGKATRRHVPCGRFAARARRVRAACKPGALASNQKGRAVWGVERVRRQRPTCRDEACPSCHRSPPLLFPLSYNGFPPCRASRRHVPRRRRVRRRLPRSLPPLALLRRAPSPFPPRPPRRPRLPPRAAAPAPDADEASAAALHPVPPDGGTHLPP
jgi:hypothetical protein